MRRIFVPVVLLTIACRALAPYALDAPVESAFEATPTAVYRQPVATPLAETVEATGQEVFPGLTPTSAPVKYDPLPTPQPPQPDIPTDVPFRADFHPDGPFYMGDQVSLEVIAARDVDVQGKTVMVEVDGSPLTAEGGVGFEPFGIGDRSQATLLWFWDTEEFAQGDHQVTISILPEGPSWVETVSLFPRADLPPPEPRAHWAQAESECCLIYYITGTAAERDLSELVTMVDRQFDRANQALQVEMDDPVTVTLLPRVVGHGGFARGDISVVYTDRNYAGSKPEVVTQHEFVHVLDAQLGGELRPTMLVEGLAVYLTGGHFKYEALMPRAAALLPPEESCLEAVSAQAHPGTRLCTLDWYQSLTSLADGFYFAQHETSYLQAAALVEFMVETWGWEAFSDFYRDIHPLSEKQGDSRQEGESHGLAIDAALQEHLHISLDELDGLFVQALEAEALSPEMVEDVRLSVQYYESVRRYQQLLDPSAYFLTAWLPLGDQMRERGIVADYLRRPAEAVNLTLETMLASANAYLFEGEYKALDEMLVAVNVVLEAVSKAHPEPFKAHPLATDYWDLVLALQEAGYQVVKIQIEDRTAQAWVNNPGLELQRIPMIRTQNGWAIGMQAGYAPAITR